MLNKCRSALKYRSPWKLLSKFIWTLACNSRRQTTNLTRSMTSKRRNRERRLEMLRKIWYRSSHQRFAATVMTKRKKKRMLPYQWLPTPNNKKKTPSIKKRRNLKTSMSDLKRPKKTLTASSRPSNNRTKWYQTSSGAKAWTKSVRESTATSRT